MARDVAAEDAAGRAEHAREVGQGGVQGASDLPLPLVLIGNKSAKPGVRTDKRRAFFLFVRGDEEGKQPNQKSDTDTLNKRRRAQDARTQQEKARARCEDSQTKRKKR